MAKTHSTQESNGILVSVLIFVSVCVAAAAAVVASSPSSSSVAAAGIFLAASVFERAVACQAAAVAVGFPGRDGRPAV